MIASLILPLLLQSAATVDAVEAELRRVRDLSASLRAEVARCYSDYPREAACFDEAQDKALIAVEAEAEKVAAIVLAHDAAELASCEPEEAESARGCSADMLAAHLSAQQLWRIYADAQCTLDSLPSRGGWGEGAEYDACYIRLAADRIDVMWARVRYYL